jgi:hypothetical protein
VRHPPDAAGHVQYYSKKQHISLLFLCGLFLIDIYLAPNRNHVPIHLWEEYYEERKERMSTSTGLWWWLKERTDTQKWTIVCPRRSIIRRVWPIDDGSWSGKFSPSFFSWWRTRLRWLAPPSIHFQRHTYTVTTYTTARSEATVCVCITPSCVERGTWGKYLRGSPPPTLLTSGRHIPPPLPR